jgi:hypothetical protein
MKIRKVGTGMKVEPLYWALQAHPELWNQTPDRTKPPESPHHDLSDIYIRYGKDPLDYEPHESVWYPAADVLPVKELIFQLMHDVRGERLGGVLITKIPAGKMCKPHRDGGWHAGYYEKFGIQIQSAPGQEFCFDGEALETQPGDVFWFDNAHTHWVTNPTPVDRITLIVTLKRGG